MNRDQPRVQIATGKEEIYLFELEFDGTRVLRRDDFSHLVAYTERFFFTPTREIDEERIGITVDNFSSPFFFVANRFECLRIVIWFSNKWPTAAKESCNVPFRAFLDQFER